MPLLFQNVFLNPHDCIHGTIENFHIHIYIHMYILVAIYVSLYTHIFMYIFIFIISFLPTHYLNFLPDSNSSKCNCLLYICLLAACATQSVVSLLCFTNKQIIKFEVQVQDLDTHSWLLFHSQLSEGLVSLDHHTIMHISKKKKIINSMQM